MHVQHVHAAQEAKMSAHGPHAGLLAALLLIVGLCAPVSASAITFTMPSAGTIVLAVAYPGTPSQGNYIIYKRASDKRCFFHDIGSLEQDVIINGSSGRDSYFEYKQAANGSYPIFCGAAVESVYPESPDLDNPYRFEINLKGGDDVAITYNTDMFHDMIIRGGGGNDILRYDGPGHVNIFGTFFLGPELHGGDGDDYLYTGTVMYGDAGNDTLCASRPDEFTAEAIGGSGSDIFCGGRLDSHEDVEVIGLGDIFGCPAACDGILGW